MSDELKPAPDDADWVFEEQGPQRRRHARARRTDPVLLWIDNNPRPVLLAALVVLILVLGLGLARGWW